MDLVEIKEGNVNRHPWELSRARCSLKLLNNLNTSGKIADVGAGDIYFATLVADQVGHDIAAVDIEYTETGRFGKVIKYQNMNELEPESLDLVLLMDVIEHIDDVDAFLTELLTKVKPGGHLFVTVPAHQFLFSVHDVFLKHFRRYNKKMMKDTMDKHGLIIEKSFYFYTSLFFARAIAQMKEKLQKNPTDEGIGNWGFAEDHFITKAITWVLNLDFDVNHILSKAGIPLPGLSLYALCRKPS